MFFLLRGLPILIEVGLLVYCLINCIQTPADEVRNLPRWAWIVLILLFPIIGGVAWLVAGRPRRGEAGGSRAPRVLAPDDDPDFLSRLRFEADRDRRLREREEDLRRREDDLRRREAPAGDDDGPPSDPAGGPPPR